MHIPLRCFIYTALTLIFLTTAGKEHNFDKKIEGETIDHLGTPYDYDSVMHYGQYGFAIDDDYPTITPLDEDAEIGQRDGPSPIDIERIQILYECITPV